MHAGPSGPREPDDLVRRLTELAQDNRAGEGRALVDALIDQLAAGQAETLYGLHSAATNLRNAGAKLEQQAEGLRDSLRTAMVDELSATADALVAAMAEGRADLEATAKGLTAVGENILDRLIAVLDERDRRDALLEKRLNARVDRLTKKTADHIAELTTVLDEHLAAVRERDVAERQHIADTIHATVERLLTEPRGKLKKLRDDTRDGQR